MPTSSVVIPTYNRPVELSNCIRSLMEQTCKPDEIIVVDDGDLYAPPLRADCEAAGIRYLYHKKDRPGLTESRNEGIRLAGCDIVFFLDDDVVLFPDYLHEILKIFQEDRQDRVGGVAGWIVNCKPVRPVHYVRFILDFLTLNSGFREGTVLPSGFCVDFGTTRFPLQKVTEVDFLPGGNAAYRRAVFEAFSFTDRYREYGLGEDKDFSHGVSKKYRLLVNPRARMRHLEAPSMRPQKKIYGKKFVVGRYLFFNKYIRKGPWSWVFFWYAVFGYLLARLLALPVSLDRKGVSHVLGIFEAIGDIARGRISLE